MPTVSTVVLKIKGEVAKANLTLSDDGTLTLDNIQKYLKKKEQPELVCTYEYESKIIFIFGYKKGKKGTESKIELPEPYMEMAMYGDAIVIAAPTYKWEHPLPFTVDQWNTFYAEGGMEEEDEEEEEEDDELDDDLDDVEDDVDEDLDFGGDDYE